MESNSHLSKFALSIMILRAILAEYHQHLVRKCWTETLSGHSGVIKCMWNRDLTFAISEILKTYKIDWDYVGIKLHIFFRIILEHLGNNWVNINISLVTHFFIPSCFIRHWNHSDCLREIKIFELNHYRCNQICFLCEPWTWMRGTSTGVIERD